MSKKSSNFARKGCMCDSIMFMMSKTTKKIKLASPIDCTACAACVSVCPQKCISMVEDKEGFLQPKIDTKQCILCHKCEKTCPILNTESISDDFETKAYAVINKDDEIRAQSSSGGVFFPLAKWVIEQGGVVFGARWNDKWDVVHDYAEDIEGVKAFMRSKYVQSVVGDTLKQAKDFLDSGRWVLYSGTPCQLGGLRAYLGKEYERLIQVDLICHGVPSPGVWRSYLKDYFGKEKIIGINFRDKKKGWIGFQCVINTDEKEIREGQMENTFFKGFLKNVYLRNSCYDCHFRAFHRLSDITLADYWGVNDICPQIYDNFGVSAVFIHTKQGSKIIDNISAKLIITEQQETDRLILHNMSMVKDFMKPKSRKSFYCIFNILGFQHSEFSIGSNTIFKRILEKIYKFIRK